MNIIDKEIYVRPGESVELFRDTGLTNPYITVGPEGFIGIARGLKGNVLMVQRPEGAFFVYTAGGDINNHPRWFASDLPAGSVPEVIDSPINPDLAVQLMRPDTLLFIGALVWFLFLRKK